jgi:hypothetical protein
MADWVIIQTPATPAKVPLSIVAISQANSSKVTRISPMPLEKGQVRFSPSNPSVDYANNLIYSFDGTAGKLVAIKLDTTTVLVVTNISTSLNQQQMIMQVLNPPPSVWKEQIIWRDAATGKTRAESSYFSPMSQDILITPGLLYDLLNDGHIMALQVAPKITGSNSTSISTSTDQTSPKSTKQGIQNTVAETNPIPYFLPTMQKG